MQRRVFAVGLLAIGLAGCSWVARYERSIADVGLQSTPDRAEEAAPPSTIPPRAGFIAEPNALSPEEERASFTLPPGFEAQLVASEPDIAKPMQLAFDEKGRLLVSTSTEYPLGAKKGETPTDRVMLLEIDGATGRATKITTFAEGFNICSGLEALPGGRVILANAPDLLLLTDTDGDGKADAREVLYTGFARDDTHELPNSFTWGIDGWLYGLQGHVNVSKVKDKRGEVTRIAHGGVYRLQPDGTRIEPWARGMSNPWGFAFDHAQEAYGSDCESRPIWQLVKGLPYQGFLQDEDPLGFAPFVTEDPHGASGFAGLVYYLADAYPEAYRDCLYLGNPITGRVHRDRPGVAGSTRPMARQEDFLVSTDPWCRPVDVELGPDGALYVADWYNRIIAHVEVDLAHPQRDKSRGRIWRIVYRGYDAAAQRQFDGPMARDWSVASLRDLFDGLAEGNAWIRRMAAAQLRARFPEEAVKTAARYLTKDNVESVRRVECFWLLQTLGALPMEAAMAALRDPDPVMRRQALRILSESQADPAELRPHFSAMLDDPDAAVARDAALALGRIPAAETFWEVVKKRRNAPPEDTLLRYACQFAAREHLRDDAVLDAVAAAVPPEEDAARVIDLIIATPTPHATTTLYAMLRANRILPTQISKALMNIFANGDAALLESFVASLRGLPQDEGARFQCAEAAFRNAKRVEQLGIDLKPLLLAWCAKLVADSRPENRLLGLEIATAYTYPEGAAFAAEALRQRDLNPAQRAMAGKLLLALDRAATTAPVLEIIADGTEVANTRSSLAREFARNLDTQEDFDALVMALKGAPANVYAGAVESLALRKPGVLYLLDAVEAGTVSAGHINNHITRLRIKGTHKEPEIQARYDAIATNAFNVEAQGEVLALAARYAAAFNAQPQRDAAHGQAIFEENCMICHRVGGVGALVGPNLDGIGNRGVDRVLQDILLPNQDIDPAFRVTSISLDTLESADGLVVSESATELVLANTLGERNTYVKSQITERRQMPLSPMPTNFSTLFPEGDFLDLLGFLLHPPAKIVPVTEKGKSYLR